MAKSVLSAPHFHNDEAAFAYVETLLWPEGPVCPHCGNCDEKRIGRLQGKSSRIGLRKCYACRSTFTVRMGSIFEDSHLALHLWLQVIYLMCASKKGLSTRQIQRMLECSMKTAWFLSHRIREAMKDGGIGPLGGDGQTVEADEIFIGGREQNRHKSKRAIKWLGGNWDKETVFSLVERGGHVSSMHSASVTAANLAQALSHKLMRLLSFAPTTRANIGIWARISGMRRSVTVPKNSCAGRSIPIRSKASLPSSSAESSVTISMSAKRICTAIWPSSTSGTPIVRN